jgi:hypothetical protein
MNLFYYTEIEKESHEDEVNITRKNGYSFNLESVIMTYPEKEGLAVVLGRNADKLNPIDYQYKINPSTKQKEPVKITKFEVTSEPIVVILKDTTEIKKFLEITGGPSSLSVV